jgi:DNA primase
MDKYEIEKLRNLSIESVAKRLGLRVERHLCLCPFHDDHHASLSFSVRKNTCRCFVCMTESMGTIDLVMRYMNKDFREACRWLADEAGVVLIRPPLAPPTQEGKPRPFEAARYERFFERPWLNEAARKFLYEERRIDPRVVRWSRVTTWKDRDGVSWLQIPYFNQEGKLVGVQNRNLVKGGRPRFKFAMGFAPPIYNLPVLNMLMPGDVLWIAEGCSDAWSMLSAGHKAIAIPSATLLNRQDVELLQALRSERSVRFEMWPDNDMPGERLFLQLQKVLPDLVHHQLPPGCKDFSEYYLTKLT